MDFDTAATKRQKARRNETVFKSLIASPFNLAGTFKVPANADFAFSFNQPLAASQLSIAISGRTPRSVKSKVLAANAVQKFGYIEVDKTIKFTSSVAGIVKLYLVKNNGDLVVIGTGSI